jgi:putative ABC transport system permease protein
LIISIVLFLSVSSLSLLSRNAVDVAAGSLPYDVSVFVTSSATLQEKKDFYAEIAKMDYADQSVIEQTMYTTTAVESKLIPDKIKEIIEPDYKEKNIETYEIDFQIRSIDETALEKYAKEVGIDVVRLKDRSNPCGILVNTITVNVDNKYSQMKHFNIEPGERLKLTHLIFGNKTYKESEESEPKEYSSILEIAAVTDHTSIGDTTYSPLRAILIVSEEVYSDMQSKLPKGSDDTNVHMFIKSSNPEKLIESINEYQKRTSIADTRIYDVAAADKANRQFETFVFVFFYGFVALITAICATNIFNTISTGILLRKREFAMLKSVYNPKR